MTPRSKKHTEIYIEEYTRRIAVMQAFLAGKQVQSFSSYSVSRSAWKDEKPENLWNWRDFDYRIKPGGE